jgi:hypothetical protein
MTAHPHSSPLRTLLLSISLYWLLLAFAHAAGTAPVQSSAGEVVLASGAAYLQREGTRLRIPLETGAKVGAGDTLQTGQDGHIYVKFGDGGFLILRPASRMMIDDYRFDPANPAAASVRLRLDEGVMRTITGAGLKGAKDRFRLNTPIAAIGVRGTDFTTYADAASTRVSVAAGGIILAPLENGCSAAGLGPCEGKRAAELFAGRPDLMLVLTRGAYKPELQPVTPQAPDRVRPPLPGEPPPAAAASSAAGRAAAGDPTEAQIIDRLDHLFGRSAHADAATPPPAVEPPPPAPPAVAYNWGRWRDPQGENSLDLTARLEAGEKLVASNYTHVLTRSPGAIALPSSGTVTFALQGAEAFYRNGSALAAATVSNPELSIDFDRSTFATRLDVGANGSSWRVQATGDVAANGEFRSAWRDGTNATVKGTLAGAQGRQAAYLFTRSLDSQRQLTGIATWSRP